MVLLYHFDTNLRTGMFFASFFSKRRNDGEGSILLDYEIEEYVNLIASGKLESTINTYANSLIVSEIMETARKQNGIVFTAEKNLERLLFLKGNGILSLVS